MKTNLSLLLIAGIAALFAAAIRLETPRAVPADDEKEEAWQHHWAVHEGFAITPDTNGYTLPTAIAFVPQPGPGAKDPLYFVAELRGTIKVVSNDRTVSTFASGFFQNTPSADLPDPAGETGMAGLCLEPTHGYVFATFAYRDFQGILRNNIIRFQTPPVVFGTQPSGQVAFTDLFAPYEAAVSHQIGSCQASSEFLYVSVGDGRKADQSQQVDSLLGKVLRMTLDGEPASSNPFYTASDPHAARNYVYAYGFRNPFGLKQLGENVFVADNGSRIDRFLELNPGQNYLWDGTDHSIGTNSASVIAPSVGPVALDRYPQGSNLFPKAYRQSFFVAMSSGNTPGILELPYDLDQRQMLGTPRTFLQYRGEEGEQFVAALQFGPDGLYFAPLMPDEGGDAVYKISYNPPAEHPYFISDDLDPKTLLEDKGCLGCHKLNGEGGTAGPALDRVGLIRDVQQRINASGYQQQLGQINQLDREPFTSFKAARDAVQNASGMEKVRLWVQFHILEPRFDNPDSLMPNMGLSKVQAQVITDYLLGDTDQGFLERSMKAVIALLPSPLMPRHLLLFFVLGLLVGMIFLVASMRMMPLYQNWRKRKNYRT